jgi:hypothetical protein
MKNLIILALILFIGCTKEVNKPIFDCLIANSNWQIETEKPYQLVFNSDSVVLISWDNPYVKAGNFYNYHVKDDIITMIDINTRQIKHCLFIENCANELILNDKINTWDYPLTWKK